MRTLPGYAPAMRTQVGIVGAGPAGLTLAHLLHLEGIESVILEQRSREYVEQRVRAGVLEQGTVDLLVATGVGERLRREGIVHGGIELRFGGQGHRIPMSDLTGGRAITIYGQQEVVKDLIAARLAYNGPLLFETADVTVHDFDTERPRITYVHDGRSGELECDVIAGCDGFHGVCRDSIPVGMLQIHEREYPFGWLGILATVAPSTDELIYAYHERGFALHSLRSPKLSRLYLQVDPNEPIEDWPDERIWEELHARFEREGWTLHEGPIIEKGITPMRSFVAEPMQYGRLYLAGDASHIVPPTGAKGLNVAVHDVKVLAEALADWYRSARTELLEAYSETCLRRVWRVQDFSNFMTTLLHRLDVDGFEDRLQRARLEYVCSSEAAARSLAENYVGLETV
jgi:p-hydroxybenzoate 3-monooxygenase